MSINSCQFNDSYFPIMDGVAMTAHNYAYWLNAKYGTSSIVAPGVKGYIDRVDYKVFRFKSILIPGMNPYRTGLPFIDFEFKKILSKTQFDILHAHCPFVTGHIAQRLANKQKIPLVATLHSKYHIDLKKGVGNKILVNFLMKIIMDFYRHVDYMWVPNRSTGVLLKEYGYKGDFEIVPNGTDIRTPDKSNLLNLRKKGFDLIGSNNHEFVLLFVGQHRWEKNVKMIIESLLAIKSQGVSFKMIFVGEGYALQDMKNLINKFKLTENVIFTGVITDRDKLMSIYSCSDLFVFPSIYDNAPLVMIEAAAFEIPSIVIRNSSASEGILDNVNGFLIDNSSDALANKIIELKQNPDIIKKTGKSARKSIYRHWESIVDQVFIRYRDIIADYKQGKMKHY